MGGPFDRIVIRRGQRPKEADHKQRERPCRAIPKNLLPQANNPDSQKQLIRNIRTTTSMNQTCEARVVSQLSRRMTSLAGGRGCLPLNGSFFSNPPLARKSDHCGVTYEPVEYHENFGATLR
jgi:hypothetical protein